MKSAQWFNKPSQLYRVSKNPSGGTFPYVAMPVAELPPDGWEPVALIREHTPLRAITVARAMEAGAVASIWK